MRRLTRPIAVLLGCWLLACAGPPPIRVGTNAVGIPPQTGLGDLYPGETIPAGVVLMVSSVETLDSELGAIDAQSTVRYFVTAQDMISGDGRVLIPAGTSVQASVYVEPRARLGTPGTLEVDLEAIWVQPDYAIPVTGYYRWDGVSKRNLSVGLTVGMLLLYPPFNFLHLLHRGSDVLLPAGAWLAATVLPH